MQGYYQQPMGGGLMPGMMPGIGGMGMGQMGMGGPMMGQMGGMGGMGQMGQMSQMGMMGQPGQFWRAGMPQDYQLPSLGYSPDSSWGAWELANARYSGDRMQRGFFDQILSGLSDFFTSRHLNQQAARDAHYRVYYSNEGTDSGNKTLGGAAAYQAFLSWDKEHHSLYHSFPSQENRERLVGLAVAELQPRSSRANPSVAAEYAAATAKHLYDRHYDLSGNHHGRHSGYGADDDSDDESEGRRMRRRSGFIRGYGGPMGMQPGMLPPAGMGMPNPGMGGFGMPGAMGQGMQGPMGMGMGSMGGPMMGGQMGGGMMPGMGPGMMQMGGVQPGMMMPGGYANPMNESQAAPGMHPYTYGANSGVAYGNQPIDQMGQPTFPGGPGRSYYGYGQQRYY